MWQKWSVAKFLAGAVVVVKRSVYSPSTLTIRVRILLTPTVFSVKFVFEKNEKKQKRGRGWPIFKKKVFCCPKFLLILSFCFITHKGLEHFLRLASWDPTMDDGLYSSPVLTYTSQFLTVTNIITCTFFKKMGQPRPLFVYFRHFQTQIVHKKQ